MSKRAFDKIKSGLDSAKAYLDGTADSENTGFMFPRTSTFAKSGPDLDFPRRCSPKLTASRFRRYAIGSRGADGPSVARVFS
jgi:hypothetical protein